MKLLQFIMISLLLVKGSNINIGLITSDVTAPSFITELSSNLLGIQNSLNKYSSSIPPLTILWIPTVVSNTSIPYTLPSVIFDKSIKIVIDAANSVLYSQYLTQQALINDYVLFIINRPIDSINGETPCPNTFFTELSYITEAYAIYDIIKTYNWQNLAVICEQDTNNLQTANYFISLLKSPMKLLDQIILSYSDTINFDSLTQRIQSTPKDAGAKIIIVFATPEIASELLRAADLSVMGGPGYAWILNNAAMTETGEILKNSFAGIPDINLGIAKTGAIGVLTSDNNLLYENSLAELFQTLDDIVVAVRNTNFYSGSAIFSYILNKCGVLADCSINFDSTGLKFVDIGLYNIKNFEWFHQADWDYLNRKYIFDKYSSIVWPGLNTSPPNDLIPLITIGLLYPATLMNGSLSSEGIQIKNGYDLAVNEINANPSILAGYIINKVYHDTLYSPGLAGISLNELQTTNALGYVGPATTDLAVAYATASANSNVYNKPIISYEVSDDSLSDSTAFPYFLRTIQPDGLQAVAVAMFLSLQNWKKAGVIYTTDSVGSAIYASFLSNVATLDISLPNAQSTRGIRVQYNNDGSFADTTKNDVDAALNELIKRQIKIIIFLGNTLVGAEIARIGSLKKMFGPDYCYIGSIWITSELMSFIDTYYQSEKDSLMQVLNGAFTLDYRTALNTLGSAFSTNYYQKYGTQYTTNALLAYDTVYMYAYAIQKMMNSAEDYNNGADLINSLRGSDFTGASGKIKISEGTNDRTAYGYSFINVQNGTFVRVLDYDPLNADMYSYFPNTSFVWGGGASSPPSDTWVTVYDCPFPQNMSYVYIPGVMIVIFIGAFLFVATIILSFFSYRKWKQIEIVKITDPVPRNWKDSLVQIQIAIEFFQFIAIAPTFQSLEIVITAASNIFMLDIMKIAQTSKGDYWALLIVTCLLCYFWFLLVVLIMTNGEVWLKKVPLCQRFMSVMNTLFLPFYGNTMFLPALALLLDAFVCDHQHQEKPYVWRDCYMECWGNDHTPYIVMSIFAIITYEPVAAYSRPLWQQAKTGLNLKIKPSFLLLKTCVQILLLAIGKSLQSTSPISHGVVFTILISMFAASAYKLQPFNYHRCNLWEFSSLLAISLLSILATLSFIGESTNIGWFIALMIGWIIIGGVSVYIQRKHMPNLLIPSAEAKKKTKINVLALNKVQDYDDNLKGDAYRLDESSALNIKQDVIENSNENINVEANDNPSESVDEEDAVPI